MFLKKNNSELSDISIYHFAQNTDDASSLDYSFVHIQHPPIIKP